MRGLDDNPTANDGVAAAPGSGMRLGIIFDTDNNRKKEQTLEYDGGMRLGIIWDADNIHKKDYTLEYDSSYLDSISMADRVSVSPPPSSHCTDPSLFRIACWY